MYDAIVVGARCAGAPTAMLLGRKGHKVLLLDRSTFPSDLRQSTLLIRQSLGLPSSGTWPKKTAESAAGGYERLQLREPGAQVRDRGLLVPHLLLELGDHGRRLGP